MQARVALWARGALKALAGLVLETGRPHRGDHPVGSIPW